MKLFKLLLNHSIRKHSSINADYFGSADDINSYVKGWGAGAIEDFVRSNSVEIMVHPMFSSDGVLIDSDGKMLEKALYIVK